MGSPEPSRNVLSSRAARGSLAIALASLAATLILALSAAPGCQSQPMSASGSSTIEQRKSLVPIQEELLRSHGLETVWYNESRGGHSEGVYNVDLLGDSLYLTTAATSARSGYLTRILRSSGETKWHYPLTDPLRKGPSIYQYPEGTSGKSDEVYLTQLDTVHCIDLRFGDLLWKQTLPFPVSSRVAADDENYVLGSDNGRAYGYIKKASADSWSYITKDTVSATPLVLGNAVFVASTDGSVIRASGRGGYVQGVSWSFKTGSRILADPVGYSRWVLVGATDYKLYCLEAIDGSVRWAFQAEAPVEDAPVVYSQAVNQESVYCIATSRTSREEVRTLFAVKLTTGEELWRATGVRKVVALGKSHLYALADQKPGQAPHLVALQLSDGRESFRLPISGFSFAPTNLADNGRDSKERGRIYLVAQDGSIQVLGERF